MTIRAYRVTAISTEPISTFNLHHDWKLVDFLSTNTDIFNILSGEGTGIVDITVDSLKEALAKAKELHLTADTVRAIEKDIAWAKQDKEDIVTYYVY